MNANKRPRFIVRRHPRHRSSQRYSWEWNRHGYPLRDIHAVHGREGHLANHAHTFLGAWLAALSLPSREAAARLWQRIYTAREWAA